MRFRHAVAAVLALALAHPVSAQQHWAGTTCDPLGSACATVTGTSFDGWGIDWYPTATFMRAGLFSFVVGMIEPELHGGRDLSVWRCCFDAGEEANPYAPYTERISTSAPTVGTTYYVPVGLWALAPGDMRTAAELKAALEAIDPYPNPAPETMAMVGLHLAVARVAVVSVAVPEPATFALVATGLLVLVGATRRRARPA